MKTEKQFGLGEVILGVIVSALIGWNITHYTNDGILSIEDVPFKAISDYVVVEAITDYVTLTWPIHPKDYKAISSPYGERDPKTVGGYGDYFHNGADIYGALFARIVAVLPGEVVCHFLAPDGKKRKGHKVLGGLIVTEFITVDGTPWFIRYGHGSETFVHEGQWVEQGQLIMRQGATGRTNSQHLHIEIYEGGYCDTKTGDIIDYINEHNPLTLLVEPI